MRRRLAILVWAGLASICAAWPPGAFAQEGPPPTRAGDAQPPPAMQPQPSPADGAQPDVQAPPDADVPSPQKAGDEAPAAPPPPAKKQLPVSLPEGQAGPLAPELTPEAAVPPPDGSPPASEPPAKDGGPVVAPASEGGEAPFGNPDAAAPPDAAPVQKPEFSGGPVQIEGTITGFSVLPNLDLSRMTATRDRPLFLSSRRPIEEAPPPEAPPAEIPVPGKVSEPAPFDYILTGVIRGEDQSIAILSQPGIPAPLKAKVNDDVNGWKVSRIDARSIVMLGPDGSERTLSIFANPTSITTDADGKQTLHIGPATGVSADGSTTPDGTIQDAPPQDGAPAAAPPPDASPPGAPPPDPNEPPRKVRQVY